MIDTKSLRQLKALGQVAGMLGLPTSLTQLKTGSAPRLEHANANRHRNGLSTPGQQPQDFGDAVPGAGRPRA